MKTTSVVYSSLAALSAAGTASALVLPDMFVQEIVQAVGALKQGAAEAAPAAEAKPQVQAAMQPAKQSEEQVAPLYTSPNAIPDKYIVVFKDSPSDVEVDFHLQVISEAVAQSSDVSAASLSALSPFKIGDLLSGYVGHIPAGVVDLVRRSPLVAFVEHDSEVHALAHDTQNGAPWGLARISHREPLNLGNFNKYLYDDNAGAGVDAYVIDTGINVNHKEFGGRATWGKTIPLNDEDVDGNGHGTHCAGTIASTHYGVAKNANLFAIKVLRSNGSGSMSDVLKGVEYAARMHTERKSRKGFKGSTANMSLGGGKSPSLDLAVNAAVKAGLHFAVAAGNENQDACNTSPAAADQAITVGASTLGDDRAYFSNWGKCVDIFAPGLNILSTYIGDSNDATATLSGTSMASPHVAGLLTYFLSLQPEKGSAYASASAGQTISPAQLKQKLIDYATKDVLSDISADSPNKLIYNGAGGDLRDFWNN